MKNLMLSLLFAGALATTALADSTGSLQDIAGHARQVRMEAEQIRTHLKSKDPDTSALQQKTTTLEEKIAALKQEISAYEATQPNFNDSQKKTWELVKTKAELLSIFTGHKKDTLAKGKVKEQRKLLRAYADGIAKRAEMLEQSASRLAQ